MVNLKVVTAVGVLAILAIVATAFYMLTGKVEVMDVTYTETPRAIAVYAKIHNGKLSGVCLVNVKLREQAMAMVEIHETVVREGGVHEMRPVEKLCVPSRGTLELKPGGYHIMIMGDEQSLNAILADGVVKLELVFDDGTVIQVEAKPLGETGHSH